MASIIRHGSDSQCIRGRSVGLGLMKGASCLNGEQGMNDYIIPYSKWEICKLHKQMHSFLRDYL